MSPLFKKLNLSTQPVLHILNAPESFNSELDALQDRDIRRTLGVEERTEFTLAFAITQAEVDQLSQTLIAASHVDPIIWIAYPKQSSKRYTCEFNRDTGWAVLGAAGFEPVRQVAIDEDWSALRFRRVAFIKQITRRESMARSAEGKQRAGKP